MSNYKSKLNLNYNPIPNPPFILKSIEKESEDILLEFYFGRHWVWWKKGSGPGLQSWPVLESRFQCGLKSVQLIPPYTASGILLKTLAYVRDIDGLTLYFDFQCFTSPLLIGDENQFWAKITKPSPAEITKPQPGYGFYEEF